MPDESVFFNGATLTLVVAGLIGVLIFSLEELGGVCGYSFEILASESLSLISRSDISLSWDFLFRNIGDISKGISFYSLEFY